MIIVLIQIVIGFFFLLNLYCEVSRKYRDCGLHASIRLLFMIASAVVWAKIGIIAAMPLVVQGSALIITIFLAWFLYDHVLKRQIKISGYKLRKLYLHNNVKRSHR